MTAISPKDNELELGIEWLEKLRRAQKSGLFKTIEEVLSLQREIDSFPELERTGLLKRFEDLKSAFEQPSFVEKSADCRQFIQDVQSARKRVQTTLWDRYVGDRTAAETLIQDLIAKYGLSEGEAEELSRSMPAKLEQGADIGRINAASVNLLRAKDSLPARAEQIVSRRRLEKPEPTDHPKVVKTSRRIRVPAVIHDASTLQTLIDELQQLKARMNEISEINLQLED